MPEPRDHMPAALGATNQGLSRLRAVTHGHSARQARKNVGTGRPVSTPPIFQAHFPGHEVLTVRFLGPGGDTALHCYIHDLYDGQRMLPEKPEAWRALRERYGNRDESRVDRGSLLDPAA
jgi:hypothetical protein